MNTRTITKIATILVVLALNTSAKKMEYKGIVKGLWFEQNGAKESVYPDEINETYKINQDQSQGKFRISKFVQVDYSCVKKADADDVSNIDLANLNLEIKFDDTSVKDTKIQHKYERKINFYAITEIKFTLLNEELTSIQYNSYFGFEKENKICRDLELKKNDYLYIAKDTKEAKTFLAYYKKDIETQVPNEEMFLLLLQLDGEEKDEEVVERRIIL